MQIPSWAKPAVERTRGVWEPAHRWVSGKARRYRTAQIGTRAAALAYHTLLALVPLVGLVFWYLSSIPVWEYWMLEAKRFIVAQLNVSSSEVFAEHFERLTASASGYSWGWVGLGFLFYTAWNLITRFGETIDMILETSPEPPVIRHGRGRLILRRLIIMLGLPVALGLSLAVTQWIRQDSWLHHLTDLGTVGPVLALPLAWAVGMVVVFFIYYFVPRHKVPWTQALRAAVIVTPINEAVRFSVGVYNNYAVSVHKVYGVLAVIPMFILWVQLAWLVLLSGALLIQLPRRRRPQ